MTTERDRHRAKRVVDAVIVAWFAGLAVQFGQWWIALPLLVFTVALLASAFSVTYVDE